MSSLSSMQGSSFLLTHPPLHVLEAEDLRGDLRLVAAGHHQPLGGDGARVAVAHAGHVGQAGPGRGRSGAGLQKVHS